MSLLTWSDYLLEIIQVLKKILISYFGLLLSMRSKIQLGICNSKISSVHHFPTCIYCNKCTGLYYFLILSKKCQNYKIFIFSIKSLKFPSPVSQCRAALPLWPGPAKTCHCAVEPRNKSHNFFCPPCLSYFTLPLLE